MTLSYWQRVTWVAYPLSVLSITLTTVRFHFDKYEDATLWNIIKTIPFFLSTIIAKNWIMAEVTNSMQKFYPQATIAPILLVFILRLVVYYKWELMESEGAPVSLIANLATHARTDEDQEKIERFYKVWSWS